MLKNYQRLALCPLFSGMAVSEIELALNCIGYEVREYSAGEILLMAGYKTSKVGIILTGKVVSTMGLYGDREITNSILNVGDVFGDVLMSTETLGSPVTVTAAKNTTVMYIQYESIVSPCSSNCSYHKNIITNLLKVISVKFFALNERIKLMSINSLREKIFAFVSNRSSDPDGFVKINISITELSKYLCVNRSALSREINSMKRQNIIVWDKGRVRINSKKIDTT